MSPWPAVTGGDAALAALASRVLDAVWREEGHALRLSVCFCDDAAIGALHARFFGDPTPTDVISFPLEADANQASSGEQAEGEVVVSVEFARCSAAEQGNTVDDEVALYVVHGALHLLGYDDVDPVERRAMKRAEKRVLDAVGVAVRGRFEDLE